MSLEDYLEPHSSKDDLFEADNKDYFSVPCGMCKNRMLKDDTYCRNCRYFAE